MAFKRFKKDPDEVLDYLFDFKALTNGNGNEDYLESGETISTKTITADTGITVDSSTIVNTNTSVKVWLSGGTAGNSYNVECDIVTSGGRTVSRTMTIVVADK